MVDHKPFIMVASTHDQSILDDTALGELPRHRRDNPCTIVVLVAPESPLVGLQVVDSDVVIVIEKDSRLELFAAAEDEHQVFVFC